MSNTPAQEALANKLTVTPLAVTAGVNLTDFNMYLETATLVIGLLAGLFALFFHIRRWFRGKYPARPKNEKEEKS